LSNSVESRQLPLLHGALHQPLDIGARAGQRMRVGLAQNDLRVEVTRHLVGDARAHRAAANHANDLPLALRLICRHRFSLLNKRHCSFTIPA